MRHPDPCHAVPPSPSVTSRSRDLGLFSPVLQTVGGTVSYRDARTTDLTDPAIAATDLLIVDGGPTAVCDCAACLFLEQEVAILSPAWPRIVLLWAYVWAARPSLMHSARASPRPK